MNMFKKVIFGTIATLGMAVGVAGTAAASPSLLVHLPDISALTAEVGCWIAEEWQAFSKVLLSVPRAVRADEQAAVTIFEGPNHMIVAATRLPPEPAPSEITFASARQ